MRFLQRSRARGKRKNRRYGSHPLSLWTSGHLDGVELVHCEASNIPSFLPHSHCTVFLLFPLLPLLHWLEPTHRLGVILTHIWLLERPDFAAAPDFSSRDALTYSIYVSDHGMECETSCLQDRCFGYKVSCWDPKSVPCIIYSNPRELGKSRDLEKDVKTWRRMWNQGGHIILFGIMEEWGGLLAHLGGEEAQQPCSAGVYLSVFQPLQSSEMNVSTCLINIFQYLLCAEFSLLWAGELWL